MTKQVFFALFFVILISCGGKTFDVTAPQNHPANPDAPQTAFEMPSDVLTEEIIPDETGTQERHAVGTLSRQGENALTTLLDAYFTIGNQLAADAMEGVNAKAASMVEAFDLLTQEAPKTDPHFWHTHQQEAKTISEQAHALSDASDLQSVRVAYGTLSNALNRLVAAIGVPASYDKEVYGFVCGMAQGIPQNGIWLQIGEDVRNPYFGSRMPKCHSDMFKLPVASAQMSEHKHENK